MKSLQANSDSEKAAIEAKVVDLERRLAGVKEEVNTVRARCDKKLAQFNQLAANRAAAHAASSAAASAGPVWHVQTQPAQVSWVNSLRNPTPTNKWTTSVDGRPPWRGGAKTHRKRKNKSRITRKRR
jgi:hypothetical protein